MRAVEGYPSVRQMFAMDDGELARVDPVVMNVAVASGIPAVADVDAGRFVALADEWGNNLRARMPALEADFHRTPDDWRGDLDFFRLGLVCWYCDVVLGVAYREDQRNQVGGIHYTDPTDLFLCGVMDTRRGTCATMALLHVVIGRRIGLPVSLACAGSHFLCRFDDGKKTYNIEATETGHGGFSSRPDDYVLKQNSLPAVAQQCGSDLRAVTPREMLGLFLGLRARHYDNTHRVLEAEEDLLLARHLFPAQRYLFITQTKTSLQAAATLFEPGELEYSIELHSPAFRPGREDIGRLQAQMFGPTKTRFSQASKPLPPRKSPPTKKEKLYGSHIDVALEGIFTN